MGHVSRHFWNWAVDDNGFAILRTEAGQVAFLHATCTEWKNLFSMEIYGRDGKLSIDGLGGSYGVEKLTYYKMLPQMGPPETTSWEYPSPTPAGIWNGPTSSSASASASRRWATWMTPWRRWWSSASCTGSRRRSCRSPAVIENRSRFYPNRRFSFEARES